MGSLIDSQSTRSTVLEASRPRLTMLPSAALEVFTIADRSQAVPACSSVQQRSELLISNLSTTNPVGLRFDGSSMPFGVADTKGAQGAYAMDARIKTRLGYRPPSPPV